MKTAQQRFMKKCLKKVEAKGWEVGDKTDRYFHVEDDANHQKAYKIALKVAKKLAEKYNVPLTEEGVQDVIHLKGSSVYITGTFYNY